MKKINIAGPAGNLETVLEEPYTSQKKLVAIICHPHPLYEGSMDNKIVTTLVRVFQRLDIVAVRFNFRGVGQSEGEHGYVTGELADLRAIIEWVRLHYPDYKLILAGFSFGAYIAAKVATEITPVALITIAPAVNHNDYKNLPEIHFPWIVVQGEADEVVPPQEVFAWLQTLASQPVIIRMPGVGHFFHGQLIALRTRIVEALESLLKSP